MGQRIRSHLKRQRSRRAGKKRWFTGSEIRKRLLCLYRLLFLPTIASRGARRVSLIYEPDFIRKEVSFRGKCFWEFIIPLIPNFLSGHSDLGRKLMGNYKGI